MTLAARMATYLGLIAIPLLFFQTGQQYATILGMPEQTVMLFMAMGFIVFNESRAKKHEGRL